MAGKNIFPLFPNSNQSEQIKKVAAYCRVSTGSEEQLHSFKNQRDYYTKLLSESKNCILAGIYADEGITGTQTKKRVMFMQMIEDCKAGKIDAIITKSVSRFGRNTIDTLYYTRLLKKLNIDVLFEKENIHSITEKGELMLTMLSALSETESRNLSDIVSWGLHKKYEIGAVESLSLGKFLGYDKIDGKAVINESEATTVRRIYQMYLDGYSLSQMTQKLTEDHVPTERGIQEWNISSFRKILSNEKYKGDVLFQKSFVSDPITHKREKNIGQMDRFYVYDCFPAIVDKQTWELVQLEKKRRVLFSKDHFISTPTRSSEEFPFCGKLICSVCGHVYRLYKSNHVREKQYKYFRCSSIIGNHGTEIQGQTFTPRPMPVRKINPTPQNLRLRKIPKPRQMLCTDITILEESPKEAFINAWNYLVDNPPEINSSDTLKMYHQKKLLDLLKTVGKITAFDYWLFLKAVSHIEVLSNGTLQIVFL